MTTEIVTMKDVVKHLEDMVDSSRILTDQEVLERYGSDTSLCRPRRPDVVVSVLSTEEVQKIVKFANEHKIPVTPRSSGVGFYGAGIPLEGGIVIDMSAMKKVRRVDMRNKWAMFEAGVTYGELQAELAGQGLRAMNPLLPHKDKSVVTSLLEREPRLTMRHHLDETIMTMEMVLPTGDLFHTGSMSISPQSPETIPDDVPCDLCNSMGPGIDWYRLIPGSLGAYGIVTVLNAKIGFLPSRSKLVFFGFDRLEDCVEPFYRMLRKIVGEECFLLNGRYLATIAASAPEDIDSLAAALPAYVVVVNLTAGEWFPEEKIAYQEEVLHDIAQTYYLKPMERFPNVPQAREVLSQRLYQPWDNGTYWKFRAKGASAELFFLTQLQRAPEFLRVIEDAARRRDYPLSDIGLYLQPKQHGRAFHMEASLPYDPADPAQREQVQEIFTCASQALITQGAFFYRVYDPWASMVYSRTGNIHSTLKRIKGVLDPNNVLSPGKLGL